MAALTEEEKAKRRKKYLIDKHEAKLKKEQEERNRKHVRDILSATKGAWESPLQFHILWALRTGQPFVRCWYHDLFDEIQRAQRVFDPAVRDVLIAMPPRHGKSQQHVWTGPAWRILRDPGMMSSTLSSSYSSEFAGLNSAKTLGIVRSDWYRELFLQHHGIYPELTQTQQLQWSLVTGCEMRAAGADGGLLGKGGYHLICDDPLKPEDAQSKQLRDERAAWYCRSWLSRKNNSEWATTTLIMQRLHRDDVFGVVERLHKEAGDPAYIIRIPVEAPASVVVEFTPTRACPDTGEVRPPFRYFRKQGEILNPAVISKDRLPIEKKLRGPDWSPQYMQDVIDAGNSLLDWSSVGFYEESTKDVLFHKCGGRCYQFWDLAVTSKSLVTRDPDFSVCATMCRDQQGNIYVLDLDRDRCDSDRLYRWMVEKHAQWDPVQVATERGPIVKTFLPLVAQLLRQSVGKPFYIETPSFGNRDKVVRAMSLRALVGRGQFLLPRRAAWLDDLRDEWDQFPQGRHDDQIDALAMGAIILPQVSAGQPIPRAFFGKGAMAETGFEHDALFQETVERMKRERPGRVARRPLTGSLL